MSGFEPAVEEEHFDFFWGGGEVRNIALFKLERYLFNVEFQILMFYLLV